MKKIVFLIAFCVYALTSFAQSDAIETHFAEYTDHDDFTSIFISQKMLGMISNISVEEEEGKELVGIIKDLSGLRILTTDAPPEGFFLGASDKLKQSGFVELMSVKENDEVVNFMVMEGEGDRIQELVLLTGEASSVVIISFKGDLTLNKIARLSKTLDIDGAEHLEKLKEKK